MLSKEVPLSIVQYRRSVLATALIVCVVVTPLTNAITVVLVKSRSKLRGRRKD